MKLSQVWLKIAKTPGREKETQSLHVSDISISMGHGSKGACKQVLKTINTRPKIECHLKVTNSVTYH